MKTILSSLSIPLFALCLVACSNSNSDKQKPSTEESMLTSLKTHKGKYQTSRSAVEKLNLAKLNPIYLCEVVHQESSDKNVPLVVSEENGKITLHAFLKNNKPIQVRVTQVLEDGEEVELLDLEPQESNNEDIFVALNEISETFESEVTGENGEVKSYSRVSEMKYSGRLSINLISGQGEISDSFQTFYYFSNEVQDSKDRTPEQEEIETMDLINCSEY